MDSKHANLMFPLYPDSVLDVAMRSCVNGVSACALGVYGHCGYEQDGLRRVAFGNLMSHNE